MSGTVDGFRNIETATLVHWLENEPDKDWHQESRLTVLACAFAGSDWTTEETARESFCEKLRDYCYKRFPSEPTKHDARPVESWLREMMEMTLGAVNWPQIAAHFVGAEWAENHQES